MLFSSIFCMVRNNIMIIVTFIYVNTAFKCEPWFETLFLFVGK